VEEASLLASTLPSARQSALIYDMASSLPEQLAQRPLFALSPMRWLTRKVENFALHRASCIVCSAGLLAHVNRAAPGACAFEWRFPPTPALASEQEVLDLRRRLDIPLHQQIVLYTGNFAPYQGMDLLYDTIPRVLEQNANVCFLLVGAGSEDELSAGRRHVKGERVHFLSRQPKDRMWLYTALADILVSPRSYGDNFPLKVFDYLAAGKPVVATDIEAHRCVLDSELALLVPPDAVAMADAILRLVSDQDLRREFGQRSAAYAAQNLSWSSFTRLVASIYDAALLRHAESADTRVKA
jgi:glycosyltransferase involved in cell wall biosynthesis